MGNILKITPIKQLKALFYFFIFLLVYIVVILYFNINSTFFILIVLLPLSMYQILPVIFLHIEYLLKNKGEEYELNSHTIIQHKGGKEITYKKNDIKKITVYVSPNYFRDGIYFTAFENYHYAKIILNSGEVLFLTSLLAPGGIDKVLSVYLKDIPYRKKKRFFCTTLY